MWQKTSFRKRLLGWFLFFTIFIILFTGINTWFFINERERVYSTIAQIDSFYIHFLYDSRIASRLIDDSKTDSAFHAFGKSSGFESLHKNYIANRRLLVDVERKLKIYPYSLIEASPALVAHYDSCYLMVEQIKGAMLYRGFKDWGIEGKMRERAHRLESYDELDLSQVLSLRRHEKDYIIRRDTAYVHKLRLLGTDISGNVARSKSVSPQLKKEILSTLNSYINLFDSLVYYDKLLGLHPREGIVFKFDRQVALYARQIKNLQQAAIDKKGQLLNKLTRRFITINLALIALAIWASMVISNRFTNPIVQLNYYISKFVRNGFVPKGRFPSISTHDEVGMLARNFGILQTEIVALINDFKSKVDDRTQEILFQKCEIEAQKQEIEAQRDELFAKNQLIEQHRETLIAQNRNMIDSLLFASKIQESLLPDSGAMQRAFPHSFTLFLPKDIVSGDFYWLHETTTDKGRVVLLAIADCTGHGVPGAFMSIVGHNALNHAVSVHGLTKPSDILNFLNRAVFDTLHHERNDGLIKNGMDIGVMAYYPNLARIEYAGAFIPLYHVSTNGSETVIEPDKIVIGRNEPSITGSTSGFTNHELTLRSGDWVFLSTDGYADQFGGPMGKKFKTRRFREMLLSIRDKKVMGVKDIVSSVFAQWKGEQEQVDDVLVFGMQYRKSRASGTNLLKGQGNEMLRKPNIKSISA